MRERKIQDNINYI